MLRPSAVFFGAVFQAWLDKIEAQGLDSFSRRPVITAADAPLLAWRALRM